MKIKMRAIIITSLFAAICSGCMDGLSDSQPDEFEQIRQIIKEAMNRPVPKGNIKIEITRYELDATNRQHISSFTKYRNLNISVADEKLRRNGIQIFATSENIANGFEVNGRKGSKEQVSNQFIVTVPNVRSNLQIVNIRYEAWPIIVPVWHGYEVVNTIHERITGTGMFVTVNSVTDKSVEIELLPYFNRADRKGELEVEELRTTVRLVPETYYIISSNNSGLRDSGSTFFSYKQGRSAREVVILMKATIGQ